MRIRWTTRIAMAVGLITMLAGLAVGGGSASAPQAGPHAAGPLTGGAGGRLLAKK
jgi:hypothetical protein